MTCLAQLRTAPDLKKQRCFIFFSQTVSTPATPPQICFMQKVDLPQLHGAPHENQIFWSWKKLPTTATGNWKLTGSLYFFCFIP